MLEKKSDGLACSSAALKMITKLVNNFGYASAPIHLGCIARLGNLKTRLTLEVTGPPLTGTCPAVSPLSLGQDQARGPSCVSRSLDRPQHFLDSAALASFKPRNEAIWTTVLRLSNTSASPEQIPLMNILCSPN
jgi:hypothetical protein